MARWTEPTPEQIKLWNEWVAERPPNVRAVAEKFEPWSLYRLKDTGSRVTVASFGEAQDGTVTLRVVVSGEFNLVMFDRTVFGITPDALEPCELPAEHEVTGTVLEGEAADAFMEFQRQKMRKPK